METTDTVVAVFADHQAAETTVKKTYPRRLGDEEPQRRRQGLPYR
jgi:hypothetical protein